MKKQASPSMLDEELLNRYLDSSEPYDKARPMVYRGWGSCLCENCMEIISMLWDCRLQFTAIWEAYLEKN